jgi:hypothetical protein
MAKQTKGAGKPPAQNKAEPGGGAKAGATQGPQSTLNSDKGSLNRSKGR